MKLAASGFDDGAPIPPQYAFCAPDPKNHVTLAGNQNPHLAWSGAPPGVKSYAILCHDPDVPSQADDVNKEGRTVPASLARVDFFHWVLIDLPPRPTVIAEGEFSRGFTPRGKPGPRVGLPASASGARQGLNDYSSWFAGHPELEGRYHGYDGPFPPWNDSLVHHYVFTLYAVQLAQLPLADDFGGLQVRRALAGHVLAEATFSGTYTLNQRLLAEAT
jgi:Raf kinase inhibitor-like YbhB/YbcL family protein